VTPSARCYVKRKCAHLQLARLDNLHRLGRRTGLGADLFDVLHDIHALAHGAKHDVLAIQPTGRGRAQKELRAVGVRPSVRHGQNTRTSVLQYKVLVFKLVAVDGLTARTIVVGKVPSLAHESRDHAVERRTFVAKALLTRAQRAEVFYA